MSHVHILVSDLAHGRGCVVHTTAQAPTVGRPLSHAQGLATDILSLCTHRSAGVRFESTDPSLMAMQLVFELLDPEALGHAVSAEVRERARLVLAAHQRATQPATTLPEVQAA